MSGYREMQWVYGVVIGVISGLVVGAAAERLPVASLLQSLVAAFLAMPAAAIGVALVWYVRPPENGGLGAVSIGFSTRDLLSLVVGLGLVSAASHVLLGLLGASSSPLLQHRPLALGVLGGLCGGLPVAWMMVVSMRAIQGAP